MKKYDHKKIESKWQKEWEKKKIYSASDKPKKKKFYSLIEFPYPSGDGLHAGHPRPYTAMDIISRKRRMQGYNVLYPIGWDAFGLPTENYAIKTGVHPIKVTKRNTDRFRKQIKSLGVSFDWSREINTTDPGYYKWTQWLFLQFYKKGLAYKAKAEINWCPKDKIGLANEEVVEGKCERCGNPVEKREKEQWMLAITKYADRLDRDLDLVDYPERVKLSQRNWIGKSEGSEIDFRLSVKHNYIILHAFKSSPKDSFYPWLKRSLQARGYDVQMPHLPEPAEERWVEEVLKKCKIDKNTVIIGHSLGAIVGMKVLEKIDYKIAGFVMAGGFMTPEFKDKPRSLAKTFTFDFNFEKIKSNAGFIRIISDMNDNIVPVEQGRLLHKKLGGKLIEIQANRIHFNASEEPSILEAATPGIKVFTTRADTLFGATYVVLAPEHQLVRELMVENRKEIEEYLKTVKKKTELERTAEGKEKTGVELKGVKAINPASGEEIPVWIADYVLPQYGTGAIMAVPAHDERDYEFAKKFGLPVKKVIEPLFKNESGDGAIREGQPFVHRNAVCAIVRNPKDDKYLCVSWKKFLMHGFVTGGVEEGEDRIETAKREIEEETGYKNVRLVRDPNVAIHSLFYHRVKQENRWARFQYFFFELVNEEKREIDQKEKDLHEILWKSKDELKDFLSIIEGKYSLNIINDEDYVSTEEGILAESGDFDGLSSEEAKKRITEAVGGKIVTRYKLRDWIFSRQRYWGEPIPVVSCERCGLVPVPEKDLPVLLPKVKSYQPTDTGESPLAAMTKWMSTKCPRCKGPAKRETDTMPNWAGSSWYYLRYADPKNKKAFADKKKLKYWTPVDWYNGGMEHTTLHLLYSRFWHKFLYDMRLVPTPEPYKKRTSHGMILGEGGVKMSKSLGNVINPDDIVKLYGADTLRVYEMFMGPFEEAVAWSTESIIGSRRFIEKVWKIGQKIGKKDDGKTLKLLHKTVKKVTEDIENMRFNTAISSMMILANEMERSEVSEKSFKMFLQILAPFAPHLGEELWGEKKSIHLSAWPKWEEKLIKDEEIRIAISVNGKVRGEMMVGADEDDGRIKERAVEQMKKYTEGMEIKKTIYVKNRLVNIVI